MVLAAMKSDKEEFSTTASRQALARVLGSTASGVLELLGFHPVDTVAKRLMNNETKIMLSGQPLGASLQNASQIVFRDAYGKSIAAKYQSLFPGLGFAAGYKIMQRVYKFGGQPIAKDYITEHHRDFFSSTFGEKHAKTMMHAAAGSLIGIGEVALLPLDVLKIKAQTNPEALAGRGIIQIFAKEGTALYRGGVWTAARNAPGSFALFGGSAACKEYLFGLSNYNDATFFQNFVASIVGGTSSIIVASPLDVIKTRIQSRPFNSPESGVSIVKNLFKNEGPSALFKGLVPKLVVVGPKLVFSFTIAQQLIAYFEESFSSN